METITFVAVLIASAHARMSVMYAHDKTSDMVAEQCLSEMYPRSKHVEIQESDEACIIFCVLKKFGIMNANGQINLDIYRGFIVGDYISATKAYNLKRVQLAHQLAQRNLLSDNGSSCVETAEAAQHKQDVCKKAKVFNDCTHLYRILLT